MNKQEAIEKIKNLSIERNGISSDKGNLDGVGFKDKVSAWDVICILEKLHEPQKPVVPKFVAKWLEWCKTNDVTLLGAISPIDELGSAICNDKRVKSLDASRWAERNQDNFARAWLAYPNITVEKRNCIQLR